MSRLVVGPFNRVEGDLEVTLEIEEGRVRAARVNSPLYRGFEGMLRGKDPNDALVYAPRICGICSVAQSAAAAAALRAASGVEPPRNGLLAANIMLAAENLADHLTHFYLFFMPDFARAEYAGRPWHDEVARRFRAGRGAASAGFLQARARLLHVMGILAGRWPHTLALQPGGTTRPVDASERLRLLATVREFRRFCETQLFGVAPEEIASVASEAELEALRVRLTGRDAAYFVDAADDLGLESMGRAHDVFLSYGAYRDLDGALLPAGVWADGPQPLDAGDIREDLSHAWLGGDGAVHPRDGSTEPEPDKADAYTWCKAPRLAGRPAETGALARLVIAGHPLAREWVATAGGNVRSRVLARLVEASLLVGRLEEWIAALAPGEPFCVPAPVPDDAEGAGMVEAARGSLGHWLRVRGGRIANYQIVAPTTWNFSPRDASGQEGPLEKALVGLPVPQGAEPPVAVQHVVRSFDPCMVCTVH